MNVGFDEARNDQPAGEVFVRRIRDDLRRDFDDPSVGDGNVDGLRRACPDAGLTQDQIDSHALIFRGNQPVP